MGDEEKQMDYLTDRFHRCAKPPALDGVDEFQLKDCVNRLGSWAETKQKNASNWLGDCSERRDYEQWMQWLWADCARYIDVSDCCEITYLA